MKSIRNYNVFVVFYFGLCSVNSSQNLALNKTATQSSTYEVYDAGRAVDRVMERDLESGHCTHTGDGHSQAWWKVDLGQVYRIQMINITCRHQAVEDYFTGEDTMYGYCLYVTNNTDMARTDGSITERDGHLCYHDNGPGSSTFNQTQQCYVTGRYVVFYIKGSEGEEAVVDLCEVQVSGCPIGQFGYKCGGTCHCATGGCDPDTGQCDVKGCQTGWMGLSCSLRCHCDGGGACDIDTGACPGGLCQSGWSGTSCFIGPRDIGHDRPTRQSSTFYKHGSSEAVDGVITKDVGPDGSCTHTDPEGNHPEAWWEVDLGGVQQIQKINIVYRQQCMFMCETECILERFESACLKMQDDKSCSDLFRMSGFYLYVTNSSVAYNIHQVLQSAHLCYHDHGPGLPSYIQSLSCPVSGQYVIFYNKRPADYEPRDVTWYSETTAVVELCEVQVLGACSAGWKGKSCDQACTNHTFGRDCIQTCHCANSDCDGETGICNVTGCDAGWRGHTCSQECQHGYFGPNCTEECHCQSPGCNHINGTCHNMGCKEGWSGRACDQPQKQTGTTPNNHHCEKETTKTCPNVSMVYGVGGSFLAISIACNIGFIIHCIRMRGREIRTPPSSTELHTYHMPDLEDNYEGLDSRKIDTTRNVYDTIGR